MYQVIYIIKSIMKLYRMFQFLKCQMYTNVFYKVRIREKFNIIRFYYFPDHFLKIKVSEKKC